PAAAVARARRRVRGVAMQGRARAHAVQAERSGAAARTVVRPVSSALSQVRARKGLIYEGAVRLARMGIFSKIKGGISNKANAALDKAIDPEKELEMAIMELEEGRKKALAELVSYKTTVKQMDQEIEKHKARVAEWEKRAMTAVRAGDDEMAKKALR